MNLIRRHMYEFLKLWHAFEQLAAYTTGISPGLGFRWFALLIYQLQHWMSEWLNLISFIFSSVNATTSLMNFYVYFKA
jgi:hypothetical protein